MSVFITGNGKIHQHHSSSTPVILHTCFSKTRVCYYLDDNVRFYHKAPATKKDYPKEIIITIFFSAQNVCQYCYVNYRGTTKAIEIIDADKYKIVLASMYACLSTKYASWWKYPVL